MICCSNKEPIRGRRCLAGFSLPEVMASVMVLALISSGVLVVINRCTVAAAEQEMKMRAFKVARENMEIMIAADSVSELVDYGTDEVYPDIEWETVVESFYEPMTKSMWLQAVCSAEYIDTEGQTQRVELSHWLTDLSRDDLMAMIAQMQEMEGKFDIAIIETISEAAQYAGVDEDTIKAWIENGMRLTEDGGFYESELDLYMSTGGNPTLQDRIKFQQDLATPPRDRNITDPDNPQGDDTEVTDPAPDVRPEPMIGDYTYDDLRNMDPQEAIRILMEYYFGQR